MAKKTPTILTTDLPDHPAVVAWNEFRSEGGAPERITILKRKTHTPVCLLEGFAGSDIVAKRSPRAKALVEHAIYDEYLPRMSIPSVHYYGSVEEEGGEYFWLFLAPARGEEFFPRLAEHRKLAAEWLARLHVSAFRVSAPTGFPSREPEDYLARLRSARERLRRGSADPALSREDRATLASVISQCDLLDSRWTDVERMCAGVPRTLIHGDFARKNMRVDATRTGAILRVFDWGTAGWGLPAADLVQPASANDRYWVGPDLGTYHSRVSQAWPHLDLATLESLATAGKMFRTILGLDGDARSLGTRWVEGALANIRRYRDHLEDAFGAAGFEGVAAPAAPPPTETSAPPAHPAVRAWNKLHSSRVAPRRITMLRDRRGSRVYRLEGMGSRDAVVAKQTSLDGARQEAAVYEHVIPHLPVSTLRFHGFVPDDDETHGWIFLEPVDGGPYSPSAPEHRVLAARWLASLHTAGVRVPSTQRLPSRGPDCYLQHLQSARRKIVQNFGNPVLGAHDRTVLRSLLAQLDDVELQWSRLSALCTRVPRTLIHGDFAPKNIRVGSGPDGAALRVFDWEHTGWGTPAADLVQWNGSFEKDWTSPDLDVYGSLMKEAWPDLDLDAIPSLAEVGRIFRLLTWSDGDAESLETKWVEQAVGNLEIYGTHLAEALGFLA